MAINEAWKCTIYRFYKQTAVTYVQPQVNADFISIQQVS